MKSILFIIYLVVFSLLIIGGFLLSLSNLSLTTILNTVISLFCVVGAIGYIRKVAIYNPNFWAGLLYLAIASLAISSILQLLQGHYGVVAFVIIVQIPILVALKRYSNNAASYWFTPEIIEKAEQLQSIFSNHSELELKLDNQSVRIIKNNVSFSSTINRQGENGFEEFTEVFSSLPALVYFVEIHTKFRVEDFANKYA